MRRWASKGKRSPPISIHPHKSKISSPKVKKYWFRFQKNPSAQREPASLPTSHCQADILSLCLPSIMWGSRGELRMRRNGGDSARSSRSLNPLPAALLSGQQVKEQSLTKFEMIGNSCSISGITSRKKERVHLPLPSSIAT